MLAPVAICCHVYLKSSHVIATPSDQTALGLMWYVIVSTGVAEKVGMPVSRSLGSFFSTPPPCGTGSKARGMVWYCPIQAPQLDPPQASIQSKQSGSCSAPTVKVPPFTIAGAFVVVDPPPLPEPLLLLLPQAARTMATVAATATRRMWRQLLFNETSPSPNDFPQEDRPGGDDRCTLAYRPKQSLT